MTKRKKDKQANIDQQNIAQKTKDPATRTSLTTGMNSGAATPAYGVYICSKISLIEGCC
jgi:hypothetical protein